MQSINNKSGVVCGHKIYLNRIKDIEGRCSL